MKNTEARREYMKEYLRKWRAKNKKKIQESNHEYRVKNKRKLQGYDRLYRAANHDHIYKKHVAWRLANPEQYKAYHRARAAKTVSRYNGLTYAELLVKLKKQGGRCGICETDSPGKVAKWHGDHDHDAGHFRGVLCTRCNLGLGMFRDNQGVLLRAIVYLEESGA